MVKKFILPVISVLAIIALSFAVVGCGEPEEAAPEETPFTQLQSRVSSLESKVSGLEVAVAGISVPAGLTGQVNSLQTDVGNLSGQVSSLQTQIAQASTTQELNDVISSVSTLTNVTDDLSATADGLSTTISEHETDLAGIQTTLDEVSVELVLIQEQIDELEGEGGNPTDLTELENAVASLTDEVDEMENRLNALESDITGTQNTVAGLSDALNDIDNQLITLSDLWYDLNMVLNELPHIAITEMLSDGLEVTIYTGGDYLVILTLYGTSLDTTSIIEDSLDNADLLAQYEYGATSTMLVVILEPEHLTWVENSTFTVDFEGLAVDYAQAEVGAR